LYGSDYTAVQNRASEHNQSVAASMFAANKPFALSLALHRAFANQAAVQIEAVEAAAGAECFARIRNRQRPALRVPELVRTVDCGYSEQNNSLS
jgi:hypothetical protein